MDYASLEEKKSPQWVVFPNPSNGIIQLKGNITVPAKLTIYTFLGNKVMEKKFTGEEIDLSDLPSGNYLVELTKDDKVIGTTSIIKN